jgi:hypothetical protein
MSLELGELASEERLCSRVVGKTYGMRLVVSKRTSVRPGCGDSWRDALGVTGPTRARRLRETLWRLGGDGLFFFF